MNCCIIDDDEALLKKIMNILSCHNQVNTIDFTFINDPSYIDYSIQYDILILDIEMPHQDGISIAKKYINTYKNTFIVFLSLHHELVFDTFQVQPYNFIRKGRRLSAARAAGRSPWSMVRMRRFLLAEY